MKTIARKILKIKKSIDKYGKVQMSLSYVNDSTIDPNDSFDLDHNQSRYLTETAYEERLGIFTERSATILFTYGEYKQWILFEEMLDHSETVQEIALVIEKRLKKVIAWVKECKKKALTTETIIVIETE